MGASYRYQAARREASPTCNAEIPVKVGDGTTTRYFLVDSDVSTTFDVTLENSDGQGVNIIPVGKLDTAAFYQATELEQKEYKLKISVTTPTYCRITVAQESDFHLSIGFTENPSIDFSNATIMFGEA